MRGGSAEAVSGVDLSASAMPAKPFVKWVGGKRQLLPKLLPIFSSVGAFGVYHEPFVGGGAVFFALWNENLARQSRLTDVNNELMDSYRAVRDSVDDVIAHLREHAHRSGKEYFYSVRGKKTRSPAEAAARLIFLNKTCFNGLYRVNNSGTFNSPWGRNDNPTICDEANLRAVSAALANSILDSTPFESIRDAARPGDLIYFDPPYVPIGTASFTEYVPGGFGPLEQATLASVFDELDRRGVRLVLSNSDTPRIRTLYARFRVEQVLARRNVNTRVDGRGPVAEVIVRNF